MTVEREAGRSDAALMDRFQGVDVVGAALTTVVPT